MPKGSVGVVWCDASIIATGVLLEIGGVVAEDAAWLRKKGDYGHINITELEAVVRGGQSGSEVGAARDRGGNGLCNRLWVGEVNTIGGEEDQNQGSGRNTGKGKDRSPERPDRGPATRADDHSCPIGTEQGRRVDPSEEELAICWKRRGGDWRLR